MRLLMLGDIFGRTGRRMIASYLGQIKAAYQIDLVFANGENAAHGKGITRRVYEELVFNGVSLISMGNHTYSKREIYDFIDEADRLAVPLNRPRMLPGTGSRVVSYQGLKIRLTSLLGVTFMNPMTDHPFLAIDDFLKTMDEDAVHIVDFHAEATSEKVAMGYYLDGRVAAVLGTHTHVQTSDASILARGTAYMTDLGMTGPVESVIGCDVTAVQERMITGNAGRFEVALGKGKLEGAILDIEHNQVIKITPFRFIEPD